MQDLLLPLSNAVVVVIFLDSGTRSAHRNYWHFGWLLEHENGIVKITFAVLSLHLISLNK